MRTLSTRSSSPITSSRWDSKRVALTLALCITSLISWGCRSSPSSGTSAASKPTSLGAVNTTTRQTTPHTQGATAAQTETRAGFSMMLKANPKLKAPLNKVRLPPGFTISYFAKNVPNARSMTRGPKGTIFVGNRNGDKVYAVVDADGDGVAETTHTIASGLTMPNGVAVHDGALYVAEVSRILRFDRIEDRLASPPKPVVIVDDLPTSRHHGWKFIAFGPDGKLYVPVGAPCNVCDKKEEIYASITRMDPDGKNRTVVAHGVRNTVGFDWHPKTKDLWFTDNGRDHLGDNSPPCELNHLTREGQHFGFPYCHGVHIKDPEFGHIKPCTELTPAAQELGPHVAPLGVRFYTGSMFPKKFMHQAFIAEHGSWNRTTPIGYRVSLVQLNDAYKPIRYDTFADGWLQPDGKRWGRPVDVLVMPDGALLVSDDYAGVIYRISAT